MWPETCFIINSWIKPHFQATCKALKEADNWTTLTTEIEDDLDGGDLQVVATKLTAIQVWMMGAMCLDSIEKNSGSSFNSKMAFLYQALFLGVFRKLKIWPEKNSWYWSQLKILSKKVKEN